MPPVIDETRERFDYLASLDSSHGSLDVDKWKVIEPLFERIPVGAGIIECGSGTGMYTLRMLEAGYEVTAMDISMKSLEVIKNAAEENGTSGRLSQTRSGGLDLAQVYTSSIEQMNTVERG